MTGEPTVIRVFSQRPDACVDFDAWRLNAERFFGATLGLAEPATANEARLVLEGATRLVRGRPREEADLRDALAAERRSGFTGMYDLARRCGSVWTVERQGAGDRVALLAAAVMASVMLGPILVDDELFGVRTARSKLERLGSG
ncbi:MAG TPA: hypothetical protein VLM85_17410 [Polyangiaceae bacterium]|nr:hypothetical protein [Polyangiaceae bacterium]